MTNKEEATPKAIVGGEVVEIPVVTPVTGSVLISAEPIKPSSGPSMTPTTTEQEDLTTAGQRKVNLIWEFTQAGIAITVVAVNMIAALINVYRGLDVDVPMILSSSLFLIIGFYFSRTNHQAIGGTGRKVNESQEYRGR